MFRRTLKFDASNADEDDADKDQDDAEPLRALEAFAEENPGEQHCDRAVERCEDADYGDLAGAEAALLATKQGVQDASARSNHQTLPRGGWSV